VLVARRQERLIALAAELGQQHGVETRVVPLDLVQEDAASRLAEAVADLDLAVVVNNAGFGYAGRFDKQEVTRLREMVLLNCVAPTEITARLLPRLRARGRGALVFVGSVAGRQPLPLLGVYAATKAFDQFLGEALWAELQGTGIDVLVLEPGRTESEFHEVAGELDLPGQPADEVVRTALETLGGPPSVVARWTDWLRSSGVRFAPRSFVALLAKQAIARQTPPEMQ
jgi:short-subunit dehydrogenase